MPRSSGNIWTNVFISDGGRRRSSLIAIKHGVDGSGRAVRIASEAGQALKTRWNFGAAILIVLDNADLDIAVNGMVRHMQNTVKRALPGLAFILRIAFATHSFVGSEQLIS